MSKPQPVVTSTACSECGLDWEAHGPKPTLNDCVRLLKEALRRKAIAPSISFTSGTTRNLASGGVVSSSKPYLVGESGPENVVSRTTVDLGYEWGSDIDEDPPDDAVPAIA